MKGIVIIAATLLAVVSVSAQEGWQFHPAPGHLFGPVSWVQGDTVSLYVACERFRQDIRPNPVDPLGELVLLPRRLSVEVIWAGRNSPQPLPATIIGTTRDPRPTPSAPISFRIDDGRVKTEDWKTRFGYWQSIEDAEAIGFLRRLLPPATRLTVSADFTDGETRSETFDLADIGELLARMAPQCAAVRPLLEDAGESR